MSQGDRQASVRTSTGTALDYNGDWLALFDKASIPAGDFNGRMLAWVNKRLNASYTEVNGALAAFAQNQGFSSWGAMGAFDAIGGTVLGDQQAYTKGSYIAYASPWGAIAAGKTAGVDYSDTITVQPASFPDNSVIAWNQPNTPATSVWGYFALSYGEYDGGTPQTQVTPTQVNSLAGLTETFDFTYSGTAANFNVLHEFYLYTTNALTTKAFEIGLYLHAPTKAQTYHNSGTLVGTYTDSASRTWTCHKDTTVTPPFITFIQSGAADLTSATFDLGHLLGWLKSQGQIVGTEWWSGVALGAEPYQGSGSMTVNHWAVTKGAASNVITNGTFDTWTWWQGGGYGGMDISGGTMNYASSPQFDGMFSPATLPIVAGKYYELTYSIVSYTSGSLRVDLLGGTQRVGTVRSAAGTYTERLLANSGNNQLNFLTIGAAGTNTFKIDNVSLTGPYDTP